MATPKRCSTCQKEIGAMHCIGCDGYFCTKDFRGHREILFNEMDGLIEKRNHLQVQINDVAQKKHSSSPLVRQINEWEKITIEKIKQAADQARQQVGQLLNSKQERISTEFKTFSQELAHLKETENFVEYDLARLTRMIDRFYQDLQQITQSPVIELHMEQSDRIEWNRLIYVDEKTNNTQYQQRREQAPRKSFYKFLNEQRVVLFIE